MYYQLKVKQLERGNEDLSCADKLNQRNSFINHHGVLPFLRIPKEQASLLLRKQGIVVFVEYQQS